MKKLFTIYLLENGECVKFKTLQAENAKKAREKVKTEKKIAVYENITDKDGNINELAIIRSALSVAKKSISKTIERTGGNDEQIAIDNSLACACAKLSSYDNMTKKEKQTATIDIESYYSSVIGDLSSDAYDYYGQAQKAFFENKDCDTREQYHIAFLEINKHIKQLQKNAGRLSVEYLQAENKDIVAVDTFFGKLLDGKAEWVNFDYIGDKGLTSDEKKNLANAVVDAIQKLPKVQKKIILYRIKNLSLSQIVNKLYHIDENITIAEREKLQENRKRLVCEHIKQAQKNILNHIKQTDENAFRLLVYTNIHISKYKSSDRHRENYWKEYRARKKAGL